MDLYAAVIDLARNVGVPAAIALYVLVRLDKHLVSLRDEIHQLRNDLQRIARNNDARAR